MSLDTFRSHKRALIEDSSVPCHTTDGLVLCVQLSKWRRSFLRFFERNPSEFKHLFSFSPLRFRSPHLCTNRLITSGKMWPECWGESLWHWGCCPDEGACDTRWDGSTRTSPEFCPLRLLQNIRQNKQTCVFVDCETALRSEQGR